MSRRFSYRHVAWVLTAGAALGVLSLLPGRATVAENPEPASTICLGCHAGLDTTLAGTPHRLSGATGNVKTSIACTNCHAGDSRHWEDDPVANPMTNPAKVRAPAEARICSGCHQNAHQQGMLERNVHMANDVSCSGCHRVHGNQHLSLLKTSEPKLCLDCHGSVEGQFARPYRHPVPEAIMRCTECHASLDLTARTLSQNGTDVCLSCHTEFAGPFPFEHQATLSFSTEEGGCMSCHEPHGSSLPRMVKQPYEPPHYQLCTQCHAVPRHISNTMHGTTFAGVPCNDCHTDIHGSYDNRLFINPSLKAQGCFNSGCHHL